MGHYRSEMGYESEDEERVRYKAQQHQRLAEALEWMIETEGLADTLATIIEDVYDFSNAVTHRYHGYMEYKKNGN